MFSELFSVFLLALSLAGGISGISGISATGGSNGREIDFCDPQLCPYQGKHIACDNDGGFSKNCVGKCSLEDMTPYIPLILKEQNSYRNTLAAGQLKCFYPATRMPALVWDRELAAMAEYNVKTCHFEHDECRSIPRYPYCGQNIYFAMTSRLNLTVAEFLVEAMYMWYEEYLDADYSVMEKFRKTVPQTGHFTTLMNDRQDRVGCAFLSCLQEGRRGRAKRMVIFTCNYPSTNIRSFPSYKPGRALSDCGKPNRMYPALCDDKIDPNNIKWYFQ